ncbi:hypothetical protein [Pantoea sp. App145]|uniref:hypothetical protein n=1 Tax=Pantoea sp. App145 TaxID=3071567 RepID=UPI003A806E85
MADFPPVAGLRSFEAVPSFASHWLVTRRESDKRQEEAAFITWLMEEAIQWQAMQN